LPGGACGGEQSSNAGGNNPTATAAITTNNPAQGEEGDGLPLPPTGTAAPLHTDLISNTPTATCPAPQK
jgi:hypothetical protein